MNTPDDLLMLSGVVRLCPDCDEEQIFVAVDDQSDERHEFCCTSCGAGLLVDPVFNRPARARRAA